MIFIKKNKARQLVFYKVGKKIGFMSLDKSFDNLNCIEKNMI